MALAAFVSDGVRPNSTWGRADTVQRQKQIILTHLAITVVEAAETTWLAPHTSVSRLEHTDRTHLNTASSVVNIAFFADSANGFSALLTTVRTVLTDSLASVLSCAAHTHTGSVILQIGVGYALSTLILRHTLQTLLFAVDAYARAVVEPIRTDQPTVVIVQDCATLTTCAFIHVVLTGQTLIRTHLTKSVLLVLACLAFQWTGGIPQKIWAIAGQTLFLAWAGVAWLVAWKTVCIVGVLAWLALPDTNYVEQEPSGTC